MKMINHPNYIPLNDPEKGLYVEFCDDFCPSCMNSIKNLNKIRLFDLLNKYDRSKEILEFSFGIVSTEDFIGLQNFSGIEDLIYLLFSKFSKKEQSAINNSTIFLVTELENSNYFHYPLIKLKLVIQGKWDIKMKDRLKNIGSSLMPVFAGKRGYLKTLTFEQLTENLNSLVQSPFDPDDFPLVFQNTKWNIYGSENLREELQDIGLLNFHQLDPVSIFDENYEIDSFKKIKEINNKKKSI